MPAILIEGSWTRSTFTYEEANDRVLGDLGLRNNNLITSGDVGNWLNESQTILARDSKAFYGRFDIQTASGTSEYTVPADSGARLISVIAVEFSGTPLYPYTVPMLYRTNYKWRSAAAGTPTGFYQISFSGIGVYPAPSTSGMADLVVTASVLPPVVTAPEDFFYIPHGLEDALLAYGKLMASIKDAYGEGKDRIAIFREMWKDGRRRAIEMAAEIRGPEIVSAGSDALYRRVWPWWYDPNDRAIPL